MLSVRSSGFLAKQADQFIDRTAANVWVCSHGLRTCSAWAVPLYFQSQHQRWVRRAAPHVLLAQFYLVHGYVTCSDSTQFTIRRTRDLLITAGDTVLFHRSSITAIAALLSVDT